MSRKTMETLKVGVFAVLTTLTAGLAALTRRPSDLVLVGSLALMTGYFVWKRRIVLRERGEGSPRGSNPEVAVAKPNDVQRWTLAAVAASLGITGLALGWSIAQFGEYSHGFVAQHGGSTSGVAVALGARCLAVVGWASSLRRFGTYVMHGGGRALWAAGSWALVTTVGYAVLATRDSLGVLVALDLVRSVLGSGVAAALLLPRIRQGLCSPGAADAMGADA